MRLSVSNLSCVRGGRRIFEEVSFSIEAGESLQLLGPNGSGKTSLLRTLAGFIKVAHGVIQIDDGDPDMTLGEQSHYFGHLNGVKHGYTVEENVKFYLQYLGSGERLNALDEILEAFDLTQLRQIPAEILSAGQKRRVGLTRLLSAERAIWILDEPTVSLDTRSKATLDDVVSQHVKGGGIVISATHIPLGVDFTQTLTLKPGGSL